MGLFGEILDWIYPPLCLHCKKERVALSSHLYCSLCIDHFHLLPVRGRCSKCFRPAPSEGVCSLCQEQGWKFSRYAACFDSFGPAKALYQAFSLRKQSHFSKDISAYLAVQYQKLCEERSWKQATCMFELPELLDPMKHYLGRTASFFFQISYSKGLKRHFSSKIQFSLKRQCNIQGQLVLLISGGCSSLETLSAAAEILRAEGAARVDTLSFLHIV